MDLSGVFSGVRIVELAQYVFVPGASVLLADQGAEVIKIETPGDGDPYRTLKIGDGRESGTVNLAMEQNNRNKKSVALDLKNEEGREALLKLIETADVFITSLRPRAIRALKLDVEDLRQRNPKLIYVRGNGLGFRGDEADKPGFDASSFWARGGICYALTKPGAQPTLPRPAFGDHTGSLALAYGIAGALYKRATTGEATVVETSLLATAVWVLSADVTYSQDKNYKIHSAAAASPFPLKRAYITEDGRYIQLMLLDPRPHWAPLCCMLDLEELANDPKFADHDARMKNGAELTEIFQQRIGSKPWSHWRPIFEAWDAPWELIRTVDDVAEDPQVHANEMIRHMKVDGEDIRVVVGPTAFDSKPALARLDQSPGMGEHTGAVLSELGYSDAAIAALREKRIAQ